MKPPITNVDTEVEKPVIYSEAEKTERRALRLPPSEPSPRGILK